MGTGPVLPSLTPGALTPPLLGVERQRGRKHKDVCGSVVSLRRSGPLFKNQIVWLLLPELGENLGKSSRENNSRWQHTPRAIQNFQRMLRHPGLYSEMISGLK